jgi:hypothetical protein
LIQSTEQARDALRDDEALVFDWHRIAICCAAAGEVSLRCERRERLERSSQFRPLSGDLTVYAHRYAYPHLAGRPVTIDCRHRLGMRRFTSDLPHDFGLRACLGRLPEPSAGPGPGR